MWLGKVVATFGIKGCRVLITSAKKIPEDDTDETEENIFCT